MKNYEIVHKRQLIRRVPAILRIDGRAFHTLTKRMYGRNWNSDFVAAMKIVVKEVAEDANCKFCYSQSDEVSFLLTDYQTINTQGYFNYEINKIISVAASLASVAFYRITGIKCAFDARIFSIPQDDVCNYFIWRQQDATRNAIQMAGREQFSHKQLYKVSCDEIQEKLFKEKGINFNNYPIIRKRGFCYVNKALDIEIPIFTQNRQYIERHVYIRED